MKEIGLEQERRFFDCNIAAWLDQEGNIGKWVLIKGAELIGLFDDFDQAVQAGFARFGLEPFFISQIDKDAHEITTTAFLIDEILADKQSARRAPGNL